MYFIHFFPTFFQIRFQAKKLPCVSEIWISITFPWWFCFRLEPISGHDQDSPKIAAHFLELYVYYFYCKLVEEGNACYYL